jgi:hypothetical protein
VAWPANERNETSKGKERPFSQVEEAGGAPHGVAHAPEVASLECASGAFHDRRRRRSAPRGHLVRRHHGLAVVVLVVRGMQLRFAAAPVRRRHRLGPGRHGDGGRLVARARGVLLLWARGGRDGRGGRVVVVGVGEERGQPHAAGGEVAGRRGNRPPEAGGRGRSRGRRGGRGGRGRGGRAAGGPDDVALVELQLLDAVGLGAGVVGLLEQAEEAERRGGSGHAATRRGHGRRQCRARLSSLVAGARVWSWSWRSPLALRCASRVSASALGALLLAGCGRQWWRWRAWAVNYWGVMATRGVARRWRPRVERSCARRGVCGGVCCGRYPAFRGYGPEIWNHSIRESQPLPREIGSAGTGGTRHCWRRQQRKLTATDQ